MDSINLTIPAISPELIANLESQTSITAEAETAAVAALRERYAPLSKHNGYVRISWSRSGYSTSHASSDESYLTEGGRKVRALLAIDGFTSQTEGSDFGGSFGGDRLYLTERGEWLRLDRSGSWSSWQGSSSGWECRVCEFSDAEVAAQYQLTDVLSGLGKSLAEMATKLPVRYAKLRQRTELASKLLEAIR